MITIKPKLKSLSILGFGLSFVCISITAKTDVISSDLRTTQVFIPLEKNHLPANDLLYKDKNGSRTLGTGEALDLQMKSKVDLSLLDPSPANEWQGPSFAADENLDEALPIKSGDTVDYSSVPLERILRFRLNVDVKGPNGPETLSLVIARDLHTYLLRKELLRRLGYRVPAMKYISKVRIRFKTKAEQNFAVKDPPAPDGRPHILKWTSAEAGRWCTVAPEVLKDKEFPCKADPQETDPLVINFKDVVAMDPATVYPVSTTGKIQIFNVAMDPPVDQDNMQKGQVSRTYRSLAVIYDLVNIPESINQADWYAGRTQGSNVTFPLPEAVNFSCTLEDAQWAIRRIDSLSRQDITDIVNNSYYPEPIAKLLVEKIIARRDSLSKMFRLKDASLQFDAKISDPPAVKDGKVFQEFWPDYATQFSHGDYPSPLKGLKYYFLSELESQVLDNGVDYLNGELPSLNVAGETQKHVNEVLQKLNSGQIAKIPMKVWVKPLAGITFTASRDVVLGNYLGTNNILQIADSMGFAINAGITMGVDALPMPVAITGTAQGTVSLILTHIIPIDHLEESVRNIKMKKELIPLVFRGSSGILNKAFELQKLDKGKTPAELENDLVNDMENLKNYIGKGESLIITESLQGAETLTASVTADATWTPALSATAGPNQEIIRRIQLFRKDENVIQVFVDNGRYNGFTFEFGFTTGSIAQFPVISITAPKKIKGTAGSKIYTVDITPNLTDNPNVFRSAEALSQVLKTGSTTFLDAIKDNPPGLLSVKFNDTTNTFQFLQFIRRHLKLNGDILAQLPDGHSGKFIGLSDGHQTGKNYQLLATQAATFLVQHIAGNGNYGINTQIPPDPGRSVFGMSRTRDVDFQAENDSNNLTSRYYVRIQNRWEGWAKSTAAVMDIIHSEMNPRFGVQFFDDNILHDISKIQLYYLTTNFNIYEKALDHLLAITPGAEKALEKKYGDLHGCNRYSDQINTMNSEDMNACAGLENFQDAFRKIRKGESDPLKFSKDIQQLVGNFDRFATFQDMVEAFGGKQNIYVNATIDGYRVGEEVLSQQIESTETFGEPHQRDPKGPLDTVERYLQIQDGEFYIQWLRDIL